MYRALIICNSRFPDGRGELGDLHGPKKDGFLLRDVLTDHTTGMFDKSEVQNLNEGESREVTSAVEEFFGAAEPDDTLLFYYSGHGRTRNQQLFLCAQDTNVDKLYSTAIPSATLKDIVASSLAQVKILVLDCCYSAMFKGGEIADEFAGTGRFVIAATSATERASDGQLRGLPSPFTGALVEALYSRAEDRDGDGLVDLDDVYTYLDTVSVAGARPHRKFDGAGAVPIARRVVRQPGNHARQDSPSASPVPERLSVGDDAAVYALESAQPDLPYLDRTISDASFSQSRVDSFRAQMRSDLLEDMPLKLPPTEFLRRAGLIRHGRLTYTGLLLFGENPTTYLPAAVVQCVRFHGTTMTAPLETIDLQGSVPELIVRARDFVAALARTGELPTAGGAYAEAAYRYPMIAVREIIANAVVHRDYADPESCVQIHAFDDRIEIISPGKWGGAPITESGEHPIGQLERRSQKRNFRLAQTLTWSKLVEGVGAGVPRSIADCESTGAPEPVVATDERVVQVTIFPKPSSEPTRRPSEPTRRPSEPTRRPSPTIRQRELGRRLREARTGLDLTIEDVASELLCSATKISRIETAVRRPSLRDVRDLCTLYKLDEATAAKLMDLARGAREPGWWGQYDDLYLVPYIGMEQEASEIICYSMFYVPALLQTADYAHAIIKAMIPEIQPEIHQQHVEVRLRRQELLDGKHSLIYRVFLDEAVLHHPVGSHSLMASQLEKILKLAQAGGVTVQIIPFKVGPHPAADNAFVFLEFAQAISPIVFVQGIVNNYYYERDADIARFRKAIEYLRDVALSPRDSVQFITSVQEAYARGSSPTLTWTLNPSRARDTGDR